MQERLVWVDNLKGVLLLLTCSSHFMERPEYVDAVLKYVPTYYVPMFFVLSGYLCKPLKEGELFQNGWKHLLVKRIKMLFVPYLFFSLVALIHATPQDYPSMIYQALYIGSSCGMATPMWFVGALLVVSIVYTPLVWVLQRYNRKIVNELLLLTVLFLLWYIIKDSELVLPWHIKGLPFYGMLFIGGVVIHKWQCYLNGYICIASIVIGFYGFLVPIQNTVWMPVCPLFFTLFFVSMTSRYEALNRMRFSVLEWVSINGLVLLGAHCFLYRYYHVIVKHLIPMKETMFFIYSFLSVFATLYFVVVPFMNTYCYRIFGKKKMTWRESYI